jgi:hypothetical protein
MLLCPHCNRRSVTLLRRLAISPRLPGTCSSCGRKIGVPYIRSVISCLPIVVGLLGAISAPNHLYQIASVMLGVGLSVAIAVYLVPLEKR